jgi:hypothetical protein
MLNVSCCCQTLMKLFSTYLQKITSHFKKVHPVGAELFLKDGRMDGQTDKDTMKLMVTFEIQ